MTPTRTWAALFGVGVLYESWALATGRHEHTLSHCTREAARTHTRPGKALFALGWLALTAWWVPHVTRGCNRPGR